MEKRVFRKYVGKFSCLASNIRPDLAICVLNSERRQKNAIFTHFKPHIIRWNVTYPIYIPNILRLTHQKWNSLCVSFYVLFLSTLKRKSTLLFTFKSFDFWLLEKVEKWLLTVSQNVWRKMKIVENKNVEINNFQKYSIAVIGAYRVFYSTWLIIICQKELVNRSAIGLAPVH